MRWSSRALVVGLLIACGDKKSAPEATTKSELDHEREPDDVQQTEIRLIAPGVEPRTPLVTQFPVELFRTRVAMITSGTMTPSDGRVIATPPEITQIDLSITLANPPARRFEVRVEKLESLVGGSDKPMPGAKSFLFQPWRVFVGTHGQPEAIHFGSPIAGNAEASIASDVAAQIKELFVAFPDEPVGVGARWTVIQTQKPPGMTVVTTKVYELVRRTPHEVTLAMTSHLDFQGGTPASADVHGTVVVGVEPWRPARVTFAKHAHLVTNDNAAQLTIDQVGRVEITPSGTAPVAIRATCVALDTCCGAIDAELTLAQRDDCKARVAKQDVEACSELFSTLNRVVSIAGGAGSSCR